MPDPLVYAALTGSDTPGLTGCLPGLRFIAPGTPAPHDSVIYRSRGSALVCGDSAETAEVARGLLQRAPKLQIALFAPGVDSVTDLPPNIAAVGGRIVSLQGHLGQFSASVRIANDRTEDAGLFSANADRKFDLVLDMGREPLLRQDVLPYGYYAPGDDPAALSCALDSLPQLLGHFLKPKYFDYHPEICTHGAKGIGGCTRCLEVCSTTAIRSAGERIEVDPYLCHGCASCTLACPTGALSFMLPATRTLQHTLYQALSAHLVAGEANFLIVHDAAARHLLPSLNAAGISLLEVNPLSAFDESLCLSALLGGVRGVVLVMTPAAPPKSRALIEQKADELNTIFSSLGGNPSAVQAVPPIDVGSALDNLRNDLAPSTVAVVIDSSASDGKRANLLAKFDTFAQGRKIGAPRTLAAGASYGSVVADPAKCTICHACTYLCPTGALTGQLSPVPVLSFKESLCVQCRLCQAGCPEQAITLQARFLPDKTIREDWRELASDQLVSCDSCGQAFTGKSKLEASLALMQEHASLLPGGIDSLRMCPGCRQRETMMT